MRRVLKWIGILVVAVIVVAAIGVFWLSNNYEKRAARKHEVTPPQATVRMDSVAIARGAEIAVGCMDCHGGDLGGGVLIDDPAVGMIYARNITTGKGGIGHYSVNDWVRSIRHGVGTDGRPLRLMPAQDYIHLGQDDLESLLGYLQTVPPVDRENQETRLTLIGKLVAATGGFGDFLPAENIDHQKPFTPVPERGPTAAYGEYLVNISGCPSCHHPDLAGGKSPVPNSPPASNLTPAGNIENWSRDDFIHTVRAGVTPEGKRLDPKFMPYTILAAMTDDDLTAIYHYLRSLTPIHK